MFVTEPPSPRGGGWELFGGPRHGSPIAGGGGGLFLAARDGRQGMQQGLKWHNLHPAHENQCQTCRRYMRDTTKNG